MNILHISVILMTAVPFGLAARTTDYLTAFGEGARELVRGVFEQDDDALADAAALLGTADVEELPDVRFEESSVGAVADPLLLFTPDFCREYRRRHSELVPLNPLEGLRATPGTVVTVTRSLAPGGTGTFTFTGSDAMCLMAVATAPGALEYTVVTSVGEMAAEVSDDGYTASASWTFPPCEEDFSVRVENTSFDPVTFVIGFE